MNVVLIGPAGSGKGTQGKILAEKFNLVHISTGSLLRAEVEKGSDRSKEIESYIGEGNMVPDTLMREVLKSRLLEEDCSSRGVILDGYPRNVEQAKELHGLFKELDRKMDLALEVYVPREELLKRIAGRFSCKKCGTVYNKFFANTKVEDVCDECGSTEFDGRADDKKTEAIEKRLKIYEDITKPVVDFYRKKGLIYSVNGSKSVETIASEIEKALTDVGAS